MAVSAFIAVFMGVRVNLNADNMSHASHIPEMIFFFSHSVITDWLVFSVISFGGE